MNKQLEFFGTKQSATKKRHSREAAYGNEETEIIEATRKEHACHYCQLPIPVGSKARKEIPIENGRRQWQYARYKHMPSCPLPEDEPL